jgi:hypothetical protein
VGWVVPVPAKLHATRLPNALARTSVQRRLLMLASNTCRSNYNEVFVAVWQRGSVEVRCDRSRGHDPRPLFARVGEVDPSALKDWAIGPHRVPRR